MEKQRPEVVKIRWKMFLWALLFIAIDRITKILFIKQEEFCAVIFCIKPVLNTGGVFGLLAGATLPLIITAAVIIILSFFMLTAHEFKVSRTMQFSLVLIVAGTVSNMFDRIFYGYVMDWLRIPIFTNPSSFNFADIATTFGVVLLISKMFYSDKK
jgi:signal peptidase II